MAGPMNIIIRPCHFKTVPVPVLVTETANAVDLHLLQIVSLDFSKPREKKRENNKIIGKAVINSISCSPESLNHLPSQSTLAHKTNSTIFHAFSTSIYLSFYFEFLWSITNFSFCPFD